MRAPALFVCLGLLAVACEPAKIAPGTGTNGGTGGTTTAPDPERPPPAPPPMTGPPLALPDAAPGAAPDLPPACTNLQCQQRTCPNDGTTSLSGTVFAPNGKLPLYNVAVYVPNAELAPLVQGVSCDRCGTLTSGRPIASALTNHEGKFRITNVPVGKDIPLVFQVGKWRRKIIVPEVAACQDTPLTDPDLTRLPKNRREGDMPRVAVTTGNCDQLGCMIPKLGIDPAEIGIAGEDKAFIYYRGIMDMLGPPNMADAATGLWQNPDELKKYDMMLNSCLCSEQRTYKGAAGFDAVTKWVNAGGRMFGSHFSFDWLRFSPEPTWAAVLKPRTAPFGRATGPIKIDTTFPKGKALADWMKFLDPMLMYGQVPSPVVFDNLGGVGAQVWASSPTAPLAFPGLPPPGGGSTMAMDRARFITMNAPVGEPAEKQCGKLVHLDVHVTAENMVRPAPGSFPVGCGTALNKAEHVLAFFIFDLAACIQEETKPPMPPPVD